MKIMPDITAEEKRFIREILSGCSEADAWERTMAEPGEAKGLEYTAKRMKGKIVRKRKRIKEWIAYLKSATPEQLIEDVYLENVAFGNSQQSMQAAKAFLESQFAGKEVADIFLMTLRDIGAEIVVPCNGHAERAKL